MQIRIPIRSIALSAGTLCFCLILTADHGLSQNCSRTSVGLVPLSDLGAGLYQGKMGGLYPEGKNARPAAHEAAGLDAARAVRPLDPLGNPDDSQGKIVFLSIGMSNTTQEFTTFKPMADADPLRNPRLVIVDGAVGGMTARIISDLKNTSGQQYWQTVDARLGAAGVAPAQVQVAWLKEADAQPTAPFPADALTLRDELAAIARILKARYPNLRIAYSSSRIYAGYATTSLNPEPFAYQSGFAVKWLIEDQINGTAELNFDVEKGPVKAPWLSWGPYLWADGLTPRSDGLIYKCSDFNPSDGTHPAPGGAREKVALQLLSFLKSDSTAKLWFLRDGKTAASLVFPALIGSEGGRVSPSSRLFTGVAVANLDAVDATLTFTAFDRNGKLIQGIGIDNPNQLTLAAGGQIPRLDFQIFGEGISGRNSDGWFRIDSTTPNTNAFYLIFDESLSVLDGANACIAGSGSFVLPDIIEPQGFSELHVANPNGDPAEVRFELFDSAGKARAAAAIRTIPARGILIESPGDLFPVTLASTDYIRAAASGKVGALLLWGKTGRYLKAMEGQDFGNGSATLFSPQYAVGGPWRSTVSVVNLDGQAGQVSLEFTDRSGNSIVRTRSIAARGKVTIEDQDFFVNPNAGVREGHLRITSSGVKLIGNVVFGDAQQQSFASALPLVAQLQEEVLYCQLASNSTYYSGIALFNPNSAPAPVTVEVYSGDGRRLAREAYVLEGRRSDAFALSTLPALRGLDLNSGYIRVRAGQPIASFALYGTNDGTALSAIPPRQ